MNSTTSRKSQLRRAKIDAVRPIIARLRAETVCVACGGQPIEWHSDAHVEKPTRRIATMVGAGRPLAAIMEEIAVCTPLCRRCHMQLDGRATLRKMRINEPAHCQECGTWSEKIVKGMCERCYFRQHGRRRRQTYLRPCRDCGRVRYLRANLCSGCYKRARRIQRGWKPPPRAADISCRECGVHGTVARSLCPNCYARARRAHRLEV